MVNEFKAEMIDGELKIKPIVTRKGNDITITVPSFKLIKELKEKYK